MRQDQQLKHFSIQIIQPYYGMEMLKIRRWFNIFSTTLLTLMEVIRFCFNADKN